MQRIPGKVHPDDVKKERKEYQHTSSFIDKRKKNKKINKSFYKFDAPYIDDPIVFKAVSYARYLRYKNNLPIELAMSRAAKYYKVSLKSVAVEMGRLGSFVRERERNE